MSAMTGDRAGAQLARRSLLSDPTMRRPVEWVLSAALIAALAGRARAQEGSPDAHAPADARAAAPATAAQPPQPTTVPELAVPVFGLGTQVVLLAPAPTAGAGAFAATYDLGVLHVDALLGVFLSDAFESSVRGTVRVFFPVHRGPIADFSLGVGGGVGYIEPAGGQLQVLGEALAGAKIRSFIGRNIALEATIGANLLFMDGDFESVSIGGRLLGAAGFMYYFR